MVLPEYMLPFLIAVFLLSITPGPGMLYMTAQTVGRGMKAGLFSTVGTHFASYVHILAAAFGLSLVLETVPLAYVILKIVGACYLFYLGVKFFLPERRDLDTISECRAQPHVKALWESFVVELTNPKSALFFIAFLPQFTDQYSTFPIWAQIVVLGIVANLLFSVTEVVCVIFADRVSEFIRRSQSSRLWMRRAAGSILIALGFNLLALER